MKVRTSGNGQHMSEPEAPPKQESGIDRIEEVQSLLNRLPRKARQIVRLFYLEGRTYEEISAAVHIPVNSIGPILTRAKNAMRDAARRRKEKRLKPDRAAPPKQPERA
jgi:RNA polymerase sigma-70 factor (ECF subfamily)